ncbi:hypothetical protein TWF506_003484 [Arthrobotrys conoides]|uniref:Uncharacterized protein n=1 Tax=Arthrobotrys conoides TaxID=74498 RepID=A0AAN8RIU2_9PEZI
MATFTLGTFIRIAPLHQLAAGSVEATLSVPEGVWAFKYEINNSLVSVSWSPSNNNSKKPKSKSIPKYRLRLWSGSEPQNMGTNGVEKTVEFLLNDPPWEVPIEGIQIDICFWFGIERVGEGPGSSSSSQTWSELSQELESTVQIYKEIDAQRTKWKPVIERFQETSQSIKSMNQMTMAEGRRAEWIWRELRRLQGGIEDLRRIISTGESTVQNAYIASAGGSGGTSEDSKLEKDTLEKEKEKLQNDIKKLKKKIAANDVDITELSETVYRLQCENDNLKDEGTGDDVDTISLVNQMPPRSDAISIALGLDDIKQREDKLKPTRQKPGTKTQPRNNPVRHHGKTRDRDRERSPRPVLERKRRDLDVSTRVQNSNSTKMQKSKAAELQEYQPARRVSYRRDPPSPPEPPRLSRNADAIFMDGGLGIASNSLGTRGPTQYTAPTAPKNNKLPRRDIPAKGPEPVPSASHSKDRFRPGRPWEWGGPQNY